MSEAKHMMELPWKEFNVHINEVNNQIKLLCPKVLGIQAARGCEVWMSDEPTDIEKDAIIAYWENLDEEGPEKLKHDEAQMDKTIVARLNGMKALCQKIAQDFLIGNAKLLSQEAPGDIGAIKMDLFERSAPIAAAVKSEDVDVLLHAIKSLPSGEYDADYITAARLLVFANEIRAFNGKQPVSALADA